MKSAIGCPSNEFFDKFTKGLLDDSIDFVEWSNDYQHLSGSQVNYVSACE